MKSVIGYLMEKPLFYRLVQSTLADRGHEVIKEYLSGHLPKKGSKILDQGCGTGDYSLFCKGEYTGLDNNPKDIEFAQKKYHGIFVSGSAEKMPFKNNYFDAVFSVGLYHHLTDSQAKKAFKEALRVTKNGGRVITVDAMLPENKLNIPGLILRKLDRGKFVRQYKETLELLPLGKRYTYEILSSFPFDYVAVAIEK